MTEKKIVQIYKKRYPAYILQFWIDMETNRRVRGWENSVIKRSNHKLLASYREAMGILKSRFTILKKFVQSPGSGISISDDFDLYIVDDK